MIKKLLCLAIMLGFSQDLFCAARSMPHPKQEVIDEIIDWYRYLDAANSIIQKDIGDVFGLLYFKDLIEKDNKSLIEERQNFRKDNVYKEFGDDAEKIKKMLKSSLSEAQGMIGKSMPLPIMKLLPLSVSEQNDLNTALKNLNTTHGIANFYRFLNKANEMLDKKIGEIFKSIYYRESIEEAIRQAERKLGGTLPRATTEVTADNTYKLFGNNAEEIKKFLEDSFRNAQAMLSQSLASIKYIMGNTEFTMHMVQLQPKGIQKFLPAVKSKQYENTQQEVTNIVNAIQAQKMQNLLANVTITNPEIAAMLLAGGSAPKEEDPMAEVISEANSAVTQLERELARKGEDKELMARLQAAREFRDSLSPKARVSEISEEEARLLSDIGQLKKEIAQLQVKIKEKKTRVDSISNKLADVAAERLAMSAYDFRILNEEKDELITHISELLKEVDNLKSQQATLETALTLFKEQE